MEIRELPQKIQVVPQATISSKSSQDATVAHVTNKMRQGSRSDRGLQGTLRRRLS
jgi:hypothetical protein